MHVIARANAAHSLRTHDKCASNAHSVEFTWKQAHNIRVRARAYGLVCSLQELTRDNQDALRVNETHIREGYHPTTTRTREFHSRTFETHSSLKLYRMYCHVTLSTFSISSLQVAHLASRRLFQMKRHMVELQKPTEWFLLYTY